MGNGLTLVELSVHGHAFGRGSARLQTICNQATTFIIAFHSVIEHHVLCVCMCVFKKNTFFVFELSIVIYVCAIY